MLIETLGLEWFKARQANATDASFPSRIPQATEPTGVGDSVAQATASAVIDLRGGSGNVVQNAIVVRPFGAGSDNNTMSVRFIGWTYLTDYTRDPNTGIWVPTLLAELACTLSAVVGVAGKAVVATDRFADTITLTYGNDDVSIDIVSPANDLSAHAVLDLKGSQKLEICTSTGSSATSCNCLIRKL